MLQGYSLNTSQHGKELKTNHVYSFHMKFEEVHVTVLCVCHSTISISISITWQIFSGTNKGRWLLKPVTHVGQIKKKKREIYKPHKVYTGILNSIDYMIDFYFKWLFSKNQYCCFIYELHLSLNVFLILNVNVFESYAINTVF